MQSIVCQIWLYSIVSWFCTVDVIGYSSDQFFIVRSFSDTVGISDDDLGQNGQ